MTKIKKFILPLALVKIILAFIVLQLFFSSCDQDDIFYDTEIYTEGPLFEIEASLETSNLEFQAVEEGNFVSLGDTLFLEIEISTNTLYDQISLSDVTLLDPEYHSYFKIRDNDGVLYTPQIINFFGEVNSNTDGEMEATFGNLQGYDMLMNAELLSITQLKVGLVFAKAGNYTFHFVNTPNSYKSATGSADIFYDQNSNDEDDFKSAYAVYLFELGTRTQDYDSDDNTVKSSILYEAEYDQAIIDFTVIEQN